MRPGHFRERAFGIRYYRSSTPGIGGQLRHTPEDFRVEERPTLSLEPVEADTGDYPYLIIEAVLTDWDTHRFVDELANRLYIHPQRIGWAGTKDARAVTTQYLSIRGVEADRLPQIEGATLKAVGRLGRQLEFGDHGGNRFELRVRGARHIDHIDAITAELDGEGGAVTVANLFGPQRFGIRRPITHRVGEAIIRGSYRDAVLTYLGNPSPHEPRRTQRARTFIDEVAIPEDRWEDARDRMPGYLGHELAMLEVLAQAGSADEHTCEEAIDALPWSLRRLFLHAVQSYLFNEIVSERLRRSIPLDRPVRGDIICMIDEHGTIDIDRPQHVDEHRLTVARRHCERGRAVVTAPLLGSETTLASGEPGRIEQAVFEHATLEPASFAREGLEQPGSRRPISIETTLEVLTDPLTFNFDLPPGAYATVVMREYLKCDPLSMV